MIRLKLEQEVAVGLAVLAGARTSRGNGFRNSNQDRGSDQNIINDLAGVIGEWAAIHSAEVAGLQPKHRFFDTSGPVKEADLIVQGQGLDAKAVALDPSRKCLIVDARAAALANSKGISAIVPVLMQQGSAVVAVGRRIPMDLVLQWEKRQFRPDTPAAYFMKLNNLALENFGPSIEQIEQEFTAQPFDWNYLKTIALTVGPICSDADIQRVVGRWSRIENGLRDLAFLAAVEAA